MRSLLCAGLVCLVINFAEAHAQGISEDVPPSSTSDQTWGVVTRVGLGFAEFNLNRTHGLHAGSQVDVYRPRSGYHYLGQLPVVLVDERQAVGRLVAVRAEV